MHIRKLSVINYKNIAQAELTLSPKLNCFIGNNGVGKTNLLDAIYFLSFCKSYFNTVEDQNIRHGQEFFVLDGQYLRNNEEERIYCGIKRNQKKQFRRNKKAYKKLSEHIGLFPLVMISPADVDLIMGGSEDRRKFIDGVISQFDRQYLEWLLRYNRALLQRNNLLKHFAGTQTFDYDSLIIWDEQLVQLGERIYQKRKEFLERFMPIFQKYYEFISMGYEKVQLEYQSQLNSQPLGEMIKEALPKDRIIQRTSVGIHKDDLVLKIGDYPIKKLGSQGQKKTYLVALKLAQFDFMKEVNGLRPILLLDDIFDKLDGIRVKQIIKLVADQNFGQIFISDTNRENLDLIFPEVETDYKIFKIADGKVEAELNNNINISELL